MSATHIENDAHWHALRAKNIGGSDIAALFGLSPFQTAFTLWHEKAGKSESTFEENDRSRWGKMLEPLIGAEAGRTFNWTLTPSPTYYSHPTVAGMGCTLDFDAVDPQWGPGIVETKVVFEYADYKRDWSDNRAPPNYELQVQHQLACTGREWAAIAVWVAQTATLAPALIRRPNLKVIHDIETRCAAFWESISKDEAPDPSGTEAELGIMRELWPERVERKIIEIPDAKLGEAAQLYIWAGEQLPGIEREKTKRKAQLLAAAKDAQTLKVPGYTIRVRQNKPTKETTIIRKASPGAISLDIRADENGVMPLPAEPSTLNAG